MVLFSSPTLYQTAATPECPTIPISSGLTRFCMKFPNPDQHAIGIGKINNKNKNKRKRNAEYLTQLRIRLQKTFDGNRCVRTPEMAFQSL